LAKRIRGSAALRIISELKQMLVAQLNLFREVAIVHDYLMQDLEQSERDFTRVMELLGQKNDLMTKVQQNSQESMPLIAEWIQNKASYSQLPGYAEVESILDELNVVVQQQREGDELMVRKLQGKPASAADKDPKNIINAYRALF
jgi:hypothetical protein